MITTLYAGLLAILYLCLAAFVIRGRYAHQVGLGDGGNPALARLVRIHGNFAEYVPFALLLLFFCDDGGTSPLLLHVLGMMLLIGRLFHAWGLSHSERASFGRLAGMVLTLSMIAVCAILLLWKYFALQMIAI